MMRMISLAVLLAACVPAFAEPVELSPNRSPVDILEIDYRQAKARGDITGAIKILRGIISILPEDCDWHLVLAEELLSAGRPAEAGEEFAEIIRIEPAFPEATIGIARTYAIQSMHWEAKTQTLKAARKGYRLALIMKKPELGKYMDDCDFVLKLLEADKPQPARVRDPFVNPLRRAEIKPPPPKRVKTKLPAEEQKKITEKAQSLIIAAQAAQAAGELDKALENYNHFMELYERKDSFTEKEYVEILEELHKITRERVYPRLQALLREKTLQAARNLLDKLAQSVKERQIPNARKLNKELLEIVQTSQKSEDKLLSRQIKPIDAKRSQIYEIVKILDEFDREVRPRLALRGTITANNGSGVSLAFFEIRTSEGIRGFSVGKSDSVPCFDNFRVVDVGENSALTKYRGVKIRIALGDSAAGVTQP